jgi:hypothetical protein
LQDWDRALIIGQQTGGKGLVMQNHGLDDGSVLYLATGRYFLPSGRCVQVPYDEGIQLCQQPESDAEIYNLLHRQERQYRCNDRTYYTATGRSVYDQMGIIPDVFVPGYSSDYGKGNLDGNLRFRLECELIRMYQKLFFKNETFELFEKDFPIKEAAKYVGKRLKEITSTRFPPEKITAILRRIMFYMQADYYGLGTQTALTLADDNLITEVRRIFLVESQSAKKQLALYRKKDSLGKNKGKVRIKKLAIK